MKVEKKHIGSSVAQNSGKNCLQLISAQKKFPVTFKIFTHEQGCHMVYFQTKNPNSGNFNDLAMEDTGIFFG
jgi:hypothetical protein